MNATERSSITRCDTHFPQVAREFVQSALGRHGLSAVAPTVDLLVSEVVTYALVGGEFDHAWIEVSVVGDVIRVEVTDPASYLAAVVSDLPLGHTLRAGGIGLLLVDQMANTWGIDAAGDGTVVWFELDVSSLPHPEIQPAGTTAVPA